jgi:hypothetical protein
MAERTFHIDNGINIDAGWLNHIAISRDGVNWEPISKDGLDVMPRLLNKQSSANGGYPADPKGPRAMISLGRKGDREPIVQFDIDNVANQAGWIAGAILTNLQAAVTDITVWLSTQAASAAAGLSLEATQLSVLAGITTLVTEAQNDLDFEIKCARDTVTGTVYMWKMEKDESTGVITYEYRDIAGAVFIPINPMEFCDSTAILNIINGNLTDVELEIKRQKTATSVVISAGAHVVPIGASEVNVFNEAGTNVASVNGVIQSVGVSKSWGYKNEIDTTITCTSNGDTLLIDYML